MLRAIIVDDERIGRTRLRRHLEKEGDIELVAECADGSTAIEAVREARPDLLFLDIQIPGKDGFDVLDQVGSDAQPGAVIFVTAFDEHAVRAFEACALDYLLKPVSQERLSKALGRARQHLAAHPGNVPHRAPASPGSANPHRFVVRSCGHVSFVAPEEIDWVEAAGNYMILHVGHRNHMLRETMSAMEAQLPPDVFLRASRSAILNLRRVQELVASPSGDHAAVLVSGQRVPITRTLREVADRLATI